MLTIILQKKWGCVIKIYKLILCLLIIFIIISKVYIALFMRIYLSLLVSYINKEAF